jgi:hypothetical protein
MSETNNNFNPLEQEFDANNTQKTDDAFTAKQGIESNQNSEETGTETDSSAITFTTSEKKIDWHKLAHKLREHNRQLLKKIFKLEQEIADTSNRLQEQITRSRNTDLLIAQQAEELNHHQEEISHLVQELETSQQEKHSQQILIESLSQQLTTHQERVAQLERDCAILQENYHQKTQELILKGQQAKELHARLHRQQRYTLQYKAALDKYVDISLGNNNKDLNISNSSFLMEPQPIKPWSVVEEQENSENNPKINNLPQPLPNSTNSDINTKQPPESNWPSPVIAPGNNDKKPKSLAAVELPNFPRQQSS